jgi:hypothetical protein
MQRLLAIAFACSALCMIAATAQAAERPPLKWPDLWARIRLGEDYHKDLASGFTRRAEACFALLK